MMTSSNWTIFRVTGHLCGEFTGPRSVNSPHKGQWRGALMLFFICARIKGWTNTGEAGDLRRHHDHYDVIVMIAYIIKSCTKSPTFVDAFSNIFSWMKILWLIKYYCSLSLFVQLTLIYYWFKKWLSPNMHETITWRNDGSMPWYICTSPGPNWLTKLLLDVSFPSVDSANADNRCLEAYTKIILQSYKLSQTVSVPQISSNMYISKKLQTVITQTILILKTIITSKIRICLHIIADDYFLIWTIEVKLISSKTLGGKQCNISIIRQPFAGMSFWKMCRL